jgi:hypothetical protein
VADFLQNGLKYGGARPTQFEVSLYAPAITNNFGRLRFFATAASLPEFTVHPATCAYFGAVLKYSGERLYGDWSIQLLNDEDFAMRTIFEKWSNMMNTLISNRQDPSLYGVGYKQHAEVTQYGKDGRILMQYALRNIWPMRVSDIPLSWEAATQIERFEVNFALDYFYPVTFPWAATEVYNATIGADQTGATQPSVGQASDQSSVATTGGPTTFP